MPAVYTRREDGSVSPRKQTVQKMSREINQQKEPTLHVATAGWAGPTTWTGLWACDISSPGELVGERKTPAK